MGLKASNILVEDRVYYTYRGKGGKTGKRELPPRLFARRGKPALALVTCGGAFDEATRTYAENVVVWAVPVG